MRKHALPILLLALLTVVVFVLPAGRYPLDFAMLGEALVKWVQGQALTPAEDQSLFLFFQLRLPRIGAAMLIGAALCTSGAVYQSMFFNPLVSPEILGVLGGASFGAAIGIVLLSSWPATQILAFAGGCAGVGLSLFFSSIYPKGRMLALIVGGLVSTAFFTALTSVLKYIADPNQQLPELVYWLMGTLSRTEGGQLLWVAPVMAICILYMCAGGKVINVLSQGDDEARAMGIESARARLVFIGVATLACALTVVLAGIIHWVGLVIPHVMRLWVGPDNRVLLPATALGGALYVLVADTAVRSVWTAELPLGIVTSLVSMPLFATSLWIDWRRQ